VPRKLFIGAGTNINLENLNRIVVRGANWVGDAVMTVPALRALRTLAPKAHITLATRSLARGIFDGADFVDELLVHDRAGGAISDVIAQSRDWRSRNFDLAILFPNSFQVGLISRLARIPIRLGYATERRGFLLSHPVTLPEWRAARHESFYYLNIIAELERLAFGTAKTMDQEPIGNLTLATERIADAKRFLSTQGIREGHPLVAICPGSINSRAKRWPAERFAAVADRLAAELDADVMLIGSAAELDVSQQVSAQMKRAPIILTGKTDLELAAGILDRVDLLITNDTGPAHIASALGRPTLVIFGPTNPLTTRPLSSAAEILRIPPDCAPCMLRDCPIDHRCMTAITSELVFERATELLSAQTWHRRLADGSLVTPNMARQAHRQDADATLK
jgi:heptosyltransferase II